MCTILALAVAHPNYEFENYYSKPNSAVEAVEPESERYQTKELAFS